MAKKFKKENKETEDKKNNGGGVLRQLSGETKQAVLAIVFFVMAILSVLSSFHKSGMVGNKIYDILSKLLGVGYFLIPILFLMLGISFIKTQKRNLDWLKISGIIIFFISGLGILSAIWDKKGGLVGNVIASPLVKLFDFYTSVIALTALLAISLLIIFETKLNTESFAKLIRTLRRQKEDDEVEPIISVNTDISETKKSDEKATVEKVDIEKTNKKTKTDKSKEKEADGEFSIKAERYSYGKYAPPPLSLLDRDSGKPEVGDIKANANIIKRTLLNFGIDVEMDEISIGPSVTRYSLKPAEGVKLSRILTLQNDLALALAAHPIRIEAPIPGKSLVGIEIPNTVKTTVGLGTILSSDEYQHSIKPLLVSLGKSIPGKCYFGNMEKMPHLLIAGATGSGKSVTIHSIITSLLFRNSPEHLKFIMIDPKRVELTLYNKIPHLLTPVITDPKKTILALKWAAKEMDRRYNILEKEKVRDVESYHQNVLANKQVDVNKKQTGENSDSDTENAIETMPYIIIVIDELADIMQSYPRELESAIVRLAQMSRAVGIHLILSTQRPSVNVITGLIKANVPARIALQVASQIDSRTILDTGGAEKLLGAGDMLYLGAEMSKPVRLQSPFISETEVKKVVKYLIGTYSDEIIDGINFTENNEKNIVFESLMEEDNMEEEEDDLYEAAKEEVLKAGKASTSYIQRKLRVGYSRAARLIDILEERGVIGPADGSKARVVIGGGNESGAGETADTHQDNVF